MKILLTGANGQLGQEIVDAAKKLNLNLIAYTRQNLNITDIVKIEQVISEVKPNYIINAAAYTAVDRAENEEELVFLVNAMGVKFLAQIAKKFNIPLLHISTDYIFSGQKKTPYLEEDDPQPLSVYGKSKLAGEVLLKKIWYKYIILRVSWVFSQYGNNFVKNIINLAKVQPRLSIISDQIGAPTFAGDIAQILLKIIMCIHRGQTDWGTYHYTGTPVTNWYNFARQILSQEKIQHRLILEDISPILSLEYPRIAPRPLNSELNCSKITRVFNIYPNNWNEGLMKIIEHLL